MISKSNIIKNEIKGKIDEIEQQHNVKLSTTQKILLSVNGPISSILIALYGEVNLFILNQHFEKANKDLADRLDINEGDEIHCREIIAHKHGRPLIYALSYIPKSRCSEEVIEDLVGEKLVLGRIIYNHEIETFRKITNISIEKPTPLLKELFKTNADMLSREYIMKKDGKIFIWTKESYPLNFYND